MGGTCVGMDAISSELALESNALPHLRHAEDLIWENTNKVQLFRADILKCIAWRTAAHAAQ